MKQYLDKIRQISDSVESTEVKVQLDSIVAALDNEYNSLDTKLKMTTKQSIGRKQKLADVYEKLNDFDTLKLKLSQYESDIEKLSKYHQKAVQQKKMYNDKINTYFSVKLSNENHKDYNKFKTIATQFNSESADQATYDANRTKYELLQIAGTFGNEKLINTTLPKPSAAYNTKTSGSRWNKS